MMPPKQRTKKSKGTPPPQPTSSTMHGSTERRHRHSYSGPSTVSASVKHSHPVGTSKAGTNGDDHASTGTDTEHPKKLADVPPPGSRISLHKFMYTIGFVALLLLAWWAYGMVVLLEQMKEEVGWWGIIIGDTSGRLRDARGMDRRRSWGSWVWFGKKDGVGGESESGSGRKTGYVESSLNALADALGISPMEVAHAVKPLVPSASLASIASKAEETGEVMEIIFEDTTKSKKTKEWMESRGEDVAEDDDV